MFRRLHREARDAEARQRGAGFALLVRAGVVPAERPDGTWEVVLPLVPRRGTMGGWYETPFLEAGPVN